MPLAALVLAAVTIAFPPEGQKLPALSRVYLIGAMDGGESRLEVGGRVVPVASSGAWAAVVDVVPGTNVLDVGGCRRTLVVAVPNGQPAEGGNKVYPKLAYAGDVAKPHPSGTRPEELTVILDPGHGGVESGATSPHALPEKDANLRLAKAVRGELMKRGFRVVMTREDDSTVALYDRPKVAHRERADAFVSIHHNAPGYATDPAQTRYQAVYAWNPLGERLAHAIERRMSAAVPTLPSKGVLHANFAVTRNPEIPSCLVEADFVTSPEGEMDIWDPARRAVQAAAIADGIADWMQGRTEGGRL